ncbi:MAG: carbon starvation protein A [Anaerolineae bacterium]|nr:carbon starvation protein A [Anaerolineae bacterium]
MLLLLTCIILLIAGYYVYGTFVESVFGIDRSRPTPAITEADGVDFVEMPTWKVFLIQLLDIAGIGPIFGPILGALYGPQALLWVVFGSIFAGAVHDFFSGMLSVRNRGQNIPEVVGDALGMPARYVMRFFSVLLLLLVGVVFVLSPAKLLSELTGVNVTAFVMAIFAYYFIATIVPINAVIGRLYPIFGALLVFMTVGVAGGLIFGGYELLPNQNFMVNAHPGGAPLWPLLFIVLSCGAISGFHSTQSPLMARCLKTEKDARFVFYGAMILEGIIALVWVAVGLSFYQTPEAMNAVIASGSPSAVVNEVSTTLLGPVGGFLAIIGVIILPITSGDTAFRSTRLILADVFNTSQKTIAKRLLIAVPLFVVGYVISTQDFNLIWRYFGWANQTLAMLVLWAGAVYLAREGKVQYHWISSLPATFMTAVSVTFIAFSPIGFNLPYNLSVILGIVFALLSLVAFIVKTHTWRKPRPSLAGSKA